VSPQVDKIPVSSPIIVIRYKPPVCVTPICAMRRAAKRCSPNTTNTGEIDVANFWGVSADRRRLEDIARVPYLALPAGCSQ
jgi:hypothetical protein